MRVRVAPPEGAGPLEAEAVLYAEAMGVRVAEADAAVGRGEAVVVALGAYDPVGSALAVALGSALAVALGSALAVALTVYDAVGTADAVSGWTEGVASLGTAGLEEVGDAVGVTP